MSGSRCYRSRTALGTPMTIDVVCLYCRRAPGPAYTSKREGAIAHRFCYKRQGEEYPAGCMGIS